MADDDKNFPSHTAELAKALNLYGDQSSGHDSHDNSHATTTAPSPANLPVVGFDSDEAALALDQGEVVPAQQLHATIAAEDHSAASGNHASTPTDTHSPASKGVGSSGAGNANQSGVHDESQDDSGKASSAGGFLAVAKAAAPYLAIFVVGLGLYYYFFSGLSFTNLFKGGEKVELASRSEQNERLEQLKEQETERYTAWIGQFFFNVSDPEIISMDNDIDYDGLTNFEEFILNLNPKAFDTLGLGKSDGQMILDGQNPWTGQGLTETQKRIVEAYYDRQSISDRIAAGSLERSRLANSGTSGIDAGNGYASPTDYSFANDPGASGSGARVAGTSTNEPRGPGSNVTTNTASVTPLNSLNINTDIPAQLSIPDYKINTPIIFSKRTDDFDKDLTRGVVHYPGTAYPGEVGTAYISGHSSGYAWQKNPYKTVFRGLGNVKDGTSFTITVTLRNGKKTTIHYRVESRKEFAANDQAQFVQTGESMVALSTCWPLDTTARRLVLFAKRTQIVHN